MSLIGQYEWKMNMAGTAQSNYTIAYNTAEGNKRLLKNSYKTSIWQQHNSKCLCYKCLADNNLVYTLSNFHSPKVVEGGMQQKRKIDGVQEGIPGSVPCPHQNMDYFGTFHLFDNDNGGEANYNLSEQKRKYGWILKLSFWLFHTSFNNTYRVRIPLMNKHNPGRGKIF